MKTANDLVATNGDGTTPLMATVREWLEEIRAPMREKLLELDERELAISNELGEIREARREIKRLLGDVKPGPKKGSKVRVVPATPEAKQEERLAFVRKFVDDRADELGEFTWTNLFDAIKASGIGDGIGQKSVKAAVLEMHSRGILTAVRRTIGGGIVYAPVREEAPVG